LLEKPGKFIWQYTLSDADRSLIHQHRGAVNRLGYAVQLCYLRFPGVVLGLEHLLVTCLLAFVATLLKLSVPE